MYLHGRDHGLLQMATITPKNKDMGLRSSRQLTIKYTERISVLFTGLRNFNKPNAGYAGRKVYLIDVTRLDAPIHPRTG